MSSPILSASDLRQHYPVAPGWMARLRGAGTRVVRAVDGVSFSLERGKTLAVVGESGCGKSTLARMLMRIEEPTEGEVRLGGRAARGIPRTEFVSRVQLVFQDPASSLNPRKRAWEIVTEPVRVARAVPLGSDHRTDPVGSAQAARGPNSEVSGQTSRDRDALRALARETLAAVGIRAEQLDRFPHQLSGGQRQRLGIARALVTRPEVLICDEPVSACDVSIQAQILNLLLELQDSRGIAYLFISHDLSVVHHLAHEILVMYLGKVVERGSQEQVFSDPRHPYTRALLASAPRVRRGSGGGEPTESERVTLAGELPSPLDPPPGCVLSGRCPLATERCSRESPTLREVAGRQVACHLA